MVRLLAVLGLAVVMVACAPESPAPDSSPQAPAPQPNSVDDGPEAVPTPDLSAVESSVREQLTTERAALDDKVAGGAPEAELAAAFGRMGQLYHAYELLPAAAACYRNALRNAPNPQWGYHLADVYRRQGQLDKAAQALNEALEERPDDAPLRVRLGQVELARDRPELARGHFEDALAADPTCGTARYGLGETVRALGDLEGAVRNFEQVLAEQPYALQVLYPLGQTLMRLGREDEAAVYLERSAQRRVSVGGRPSCTDPWDAELSELTRSAAAHLTRGLRATYGGRHEEALAEYRKALALAPEDPVVHQSLGTALAATGQLAEALASYREAVRLAPDDPELNKDLGMVAASQGEWAEAQRHFERAVELNPSFEEPRLHLARLHQQQGRPAEARAQFQQVLAANPDQVEARLEVARARIRDGEREAVARELAQYLDSRPPTDVGDRLRLAMFMATLGDLGRALQHLEAIATSEATSSVRAQAHLRIGQIRILSGDPDAAATSFRAALDLEPNFEDARAELDRLAEEGGSGG